MNEAHEKVLQAMRHGVRDARHIATCLEFGPRFLHSTGQAYKGGPNTGVFLQITCDDAFDLPVPNQKYTFGVVKAAQARGDFEVLVERKRCPSWCGRRRSLGYLAGCIRFGAAVASDKQPGSCESQAHVESRPTGRNPWLILLYDPRPAAHATGPERTRRLRTSACCRTVVIPSC